MSITNFLRRTAVALGAIAAMTVTGAAAQVMTLSGTSANTCAFTTMSVAPNGNITVQCGGSTAPGTFTLTAPATLSTGITTTTQIKVNRASGSAGAATVDYSVGGTNNCTTGGTNVSFGDGDATAKSIIITTGATAGQCTVTLSNPSVGTLGTIYTKTINVVDPNADVVIGFAAPTSVETVGGGTHQIVVTREGGSANDYTVPFTLSGGLTSSGNMRTDTGTVIPATKILSFPAGSTQAVITYTAPSISPTSVSVPQDLTILLGAATPASTGAQNATVDPAANRHDMTLNGPPAGCPTPTVVKDFGGAGTWTLLNLPNNGIATYNMPVPQLGRSNLKVSLSETTTTFPVSPWNYEIHVNKCKGLVQPTSGDKCYAISGNKTLFEMTVFTKLGVTTGYDTVAEIKSKACYAPATDGPYYINIRYKYAGCTAVGGICGWHAKWYTGAAY